MSATSLSLTQQYLIPEEPPTLGQVEQIPTNRLPPDDQILSPAPSAALVEGIRRWGVLEPVVVRAAGGALAYGDPTCLVAGRRRIKAVRLLQAQYKAACDKLAREAADDQQLSTLPAYVQAYAQLKRFTTIPVRVLSDPEGTARDGRAAVLTVASNAVRQDNPVADFRAIVYLLERLERDGLPEKEALSAVAQATGLPVQTIKQRLRLADLDPALQVAFLEGRLPYSVALHASRLGGESQELLADLLANGETPSLALVKEAKRRSARAAQGTLFDALAPGPGPGAGAEGLPEPEPMNAPDRARWLLPQLDAVRIPIVQEAADVIRSLLGEEAGGGADD